MKKIFWWIAGGVLLTTGAFFIPEQAGSMWPSVIWACVMAAAYLVIFLAFWVRRLSSQKKKVVAVTCTVLLVFSGASAVISYEGSMRQQNTLSDIRETIEQGILYNNIHQPLMKTFASYHGSDGDDLARFFVNRYDSLITEGQAFHFGQREEEGQTLFLYVVQATADSVVLVGESTVLSGKKSDFSNFSGAKGNYQVRGILTTKGVDYERQN